jgi:annexin A7/11
MEGFDANVDAETLKNSLSPKKDENNIIKLVTNRTNYQLQQIKEAYNTLYKGDLIKDLKKALSGHFEDVVVGLFYTPIDYDCFHLRKAIKGLGTDEKALIEILCTRPSNVIE